MGWKDKPDTTINAGTVTRTIVGLHYCRTADIWPLVFTATDEAKRQKRRKASRGVTPEGK